MCLKSACNQTVVWFFHRGCRHSRRFLRDLHCSSFCVGQVILVESPVHRLPNLSLLATLMVPGPWRREPATTELPSWVGPTRICFRIRTFADFCVHLKGAFNIFKARCRSYIKLLCKEYVKPDFWGEKVDLGIFCPLPLPVSSERVGQHRSSDQKRARAVWATTETPYILSGTAHCSFAVTENQEILSCHWNSEPLCPCSSLVPLGFWTQLSHTIAV